MIFKNTLARVQEKPSSQAMSDPQPQIWALWLSSIRAMLKRATHLGPLGQVSVTMSFHEGSFLGGSFLRPSVVTFGSFLSQWATPCQVPP